MLCVVSNTEPIYDSITRLYIRHMFSLGKLIQGNRTLAPLRDNPGFNSRKERAVKVNSGALLVLKASWFVDVIGRLSEFVKAGMCVANQSCRLSRPTSIIVLIFF